MGATKVPPTCGEGILFLDELTSAPQMTQAGCYQLVLDRKLGEYQLPDGWVVIAAGQSGLRDEVCTSRCRGRCAIGSSILSLSRTSWTGASGQ